MDHEHSFVTLHVYGRDCVHRLYQCSECSMLKFEYHSSNMVTYYLGGKLVAVEQSSKALDNCGNADRLVDRQPTTSN